jgi:hypothetical protein
LIDVAAEEYRQFVIDVLMGVCVVLIIEPHADDVTAYGPADRLEDGFRDRGIVKFGIIHAGAQKA